MHINQHIKHLQDVRRAVIMLLFGHSPAEIVELSPAQEQAVATYVQTIVISETGDEIRAAIDRTGPI